MSVVVTFQTPTIINSLPLISNLETVANIYAQNEDKCFEDQSIDNLSEAIYLPLAEWLTSDLNVNNICGIIFFKWQPPE
jgi:hypothetical protein